MEVREPPSLVFAIEIVPHRRRFLEHSDEGNTSERLHRDVLIVIENLLFRPPRREEPENEFDPNPRTLDDGLSGENSWYRVNVILPVHAKIITSVRAEVLTPVVNTEANVSGGYSVRV